MIRCLFVVAGGLILAACGARGDLKAVPGTKPPAVAYGATVAATANELTTAGTQERPERSDELVERSEERRNDEFDRPPPNR